MLVSASTDARASASVIEPTMDNNFILTVVVFVRLLLTQVFVRVVVLVVGWSVGLSHWLFLWMQVAVLFGRE